jgi:hypothetical protein
MWYKIVVEICTLMWTGILPATSCPWTRSSYVPVGVPVGFVAMFFQLWTHEVQCWTRNHRAFVTEKMSPEELLKYSGFTVPHTHTHKYMYGKSLWNSFTDGWKMNRKT